MIECDCAIKLKIQIPQIFGHSVIACVNEAVSKSYPTAPSCELFQKHVKKRVNFFAGWGLGARGGGEGCPHCFSVASQPIFSYTAFKCVAMQDRLSWLLMTIQYNCANLLFHQTTAKQSSIDNFISSHIGFQLQFITNPQAQQSSSSSNFFLLKDTRF